ncbi:MAG: hypothetical protein E7603_01080 [Ruminococcaceae bacterium]|nr:hypothetical protein [Oscillospiraceae bacterium]
MKKKICITVSVCVLVFGLIFLGVMASLNYGYSEGRVLIADSGAYFIILNDHSPIRMTDRSLSGGLFGDLQTGDRICVVHGSIQESYPGNTAVYYLRRLEKGTVEDVFPDVIHTLTELGWFEK